jgi:proteasome lid subunit RPN8/RPN11
MKPTVIACVSPQRGSSEADIVTMPADVCLRFVREAERIHDAGVKSYGLFIAEPDAPGYPFCATDVVFLDPNRNRRNEVGNREAFEAQGDYFRRYDDAGFVADPAELLAAYRRIEESGREIVAVFHSHRRQPPNFSWIDFRLHNPAFPWHLIASFRGGPLPQLQPFRVDKQGGGLGISSADDRRGSELSYPGPEVRPLGLLVEGTPAGVDACLVATSTGLRFATAVAPKRRAYRQVA